MVTVLSRPMSRIIVLWVFVMVAGACGQVSEGELVNPPSNTGTSGTTAEVAGTLPPTGWLEDFYFLGTTEGLAFATISLSGEPDAITSDSGIETATYSGQVVEVLWIPTDREPLADSVKALGSFTLSYNADATSGPPDLFPEGDSVSQIYALINEHGETSVFARSDLDDRGSGGELAWVIRGIQSDLIPKFDAAYVCEAELGIQEPPGAGGSDPVGWFVQHLIAIDEVASEALLAEQVEADAEEIASSTSFYDEVLDEELEADLSHIAYQLAAEVPLEELDIRRVAPVFVDVSSYEGDPQVLYFLATDGELLGFANLGSAPGEGLIEYDVPVPRPGMDMVLAVSSVAFDPACQQWRSELETQATVPPSLLSGTERALIDAATWTVKAVSADDIREFRQQTR